jgi:prepilin-type N-terminal cleavage/methylation domain-containing protein
MCPSELRARRQRRPARRHPERQHAGGFTLIELLVAVALLGSILTILFGAFSQISRGAASVQERLEEAQALRRLTGLIADELAAAQYLKQLASAKPKLATGIVAELEHQTGGDFTRIDFHAAVPARFHRQIQPEQDPFLHEIGYRVRLGEDRQHTELARREDYYLDDDLKNSRTGGVEAALARDVRAFRVEFLPPRVEGQTSTVEDWQDRWDSGARAEKEEMPIALRVTLTLAGRNGRELTETLDVNLPQAGSVTAATAPKQNPLEPGSPNPKPGSPNGPPNSDTPDNGKKDKPKKKGGQR